MRFHHTLLALSLSAALSACGSARGGDEDAEAQHERVSGTSSTNVARGMRDEVGELVQHLGQRLWIVFQDKRNRYWFGSDGDGVYRHDGHSVVHYTTRHGLCDDHIRQILEDESGNLYFNTLGGISRFDGRSFETLIPRTSENPADGWKLRPKDLWFKGTQDDNGPLRYDGEVLHRLEFPRHPLEDKFRALFPKVPYSPYGIYVVSKDSHGSVWFGTACFGACRFDGTSFTWVSESELTELDDGPSFGVRGIVEDKDGKFWFSNTYHRYDVPPADSTARLQGAAHYSQAKGIGVSAAHELANYASFVSGVRGRDDAMWLATLSAGVWRYDGQNLTRYPVVESDQAVRLFTIYADNAGVLWLGSTDAGAYSFNGKAFERFSP